MKISISSILTKWQIDACAVLICAALTASAWSLGIAPLYEKQRAAAARRHELSAESQRAKSLAAQVRQTTTRLAAVRKQLDDVRLNLQPGSRLNQRIAELAAAAAQAGLEVSDVRPGRAVAGQRHAIQPIEMSGTGSYPAAVQFVRRFHESFRDSGVASFELAGNPSTPGTHASFHFRIHWYIEPATASAAP